MVGSLTPDRALLYHFTHVGNLSSIFGGGRLVADRATADVGLAHDVGDAGVEVKRRTRAVPHRPGGVVADYVPFYFAPRSPMMFRIACDHRDSVPGRYPDGDDPLVYLMTSVDRVVGVPTCDGWRPTATPQPPSRSSPATRATWRISSTGS